MHRRVSWVVCCLIVLALSLSSTRQARAGQVCVSSLPRNVDAGALEHTMIELLQRSETFQQQCFQIAHSRVLRVKIAIVPDLLSATRAATALERFEAGALRAEISIVFGDNYVELLGHEFEHVLEWLESVNYKDARAAGRAWLTPEGAYETRRAAAAGLQVWREFEASALEAVQPDGRKVPARRHQFD